MTFASDALRWCNACRALDELLAQEPTQQQAVLDLSTQRACELLSAGGQRSLRLAASPKKEWTRTALLALVAAVKRNLRGNLRRDPHDRCSAIFYLPYLHERIDCVQQLIALHQRWLCISRPPLAVFVDGAERYGARLAAVTAACRAHVGAACLVAVESRYAGVAQLAADVARCIEAARDGANLPQLKRRPELDACALQHATELARRGVLSHRSADGTDVSVRIARNGYRARAYGENVAIGSFDAADIVARWMASASHRRNVLSDAYEHLGVAFAATAASVQGAAGNGVCVSVFGAQMPSAAACALT